MKTLLILRHASPTQSSPDGTDFSRQLTALGQAEARVQGGFLREAGVLPEVILTSAAVRAADTADLVREALGGGPRVLKERELYNSDAETLLAAVRGLPEPTRVALIVAHIPGVAELLSLLVNEPEDRSIAFTPGTLVSVVLASARRWADVRPRSGALEWVIPPLVLRQA